MRIPLGIGNIAGSKRAYLTMLIRCPKTRVPLQTNAVIDTGSPYYLIIEHRDTIRSQFPYKKMTSREVIPVGGSKIEVFPVRSSSIWVKTEENKTHIFRPTEVFFSSPTSKKTDMSTIIPNLIGVDFLEENELKLVFDPSKDVAYLESSE